MGKSVKASDHLDRVAGLGCIVCHQLGHGYTPAEVHHIGDTSDRSDFLTIPLCPEHHRGASGFHGLGEREFNRRFKTSETKLLAATLERMA
jgi:hypothetical protein